MCSSDLLPIPQNELLETAVMKILIIIAGFLLSLGSSGWFIRTYYGRDAEYRQALEAERSLSEEKAELAKKLAKDLKTIEQSNSLESIRTRMEYLRQQLSRLDEERRDILNSEEELRLLEERLKDLKSQLSE